MKVPQLWAIVAAVALAAAAGCGNSKGLVPVEGRVTFSGKQPSASGYLYFVPREMSVNERQDRIGPRLGTAIFLQDGTFRAGTFMPGDGLRPGTYEVRIECAATAADNADRKATHDAASPTLVPAGFTPPDLFVSSTGGHRVVYDLDVK